MQLSASFIHWADPTGLVPATAATDAVRPRRLRPAIRTAMAIVALVPSPTQLVILVGLAAGAILAAPFDVGFGLAIALPLAAGLEWARLHARKACRGYRPDTPLLRGAMHLMMFVVAVVLSVRLFPVAPFYAVGMVLCFGVSAAYHRAPWSANARRYMQRLDHSAIFVFIAGTFTAVVPDSALGTLMLWIVSVGSILGMIVKLFLPNPPMWVKAVLAVLYGLLGWAALVNVPEIVSRYGWAPIGLLIAGGVAYTIGGIVHWRERPNPWPAVFGFHEVFHALTIVAALTQYAAIDGWLLPGQS